MAVAQALYLATSEYDTAFQRIKNVVVVPRFAILSDDTFVLVIGGLGFVLLARG